MDLTDGKRSLKQTHLSVWKRIGDFMPQKADSCCPDLVVGIRTLH